MRVIACYWQLTFRSVAARNQTQLTLIESQSKDILRPTMGSLVVLTGASGSGKTTIARSVEQLGVPNCEVHFFDSIGVPSIERMRDKYSLEHDPGAAWQRDMTFEWIRRIRTILNRGTSVLFEGQMRIAFIKKALLASNIRGARVVLVDCDDVTRTRRLNGARGQADLANPDMMNWARFLREEASAAQIGVLDTARLSVAECVALVLGWLGLAGRTTYVESLR